MRKRKKERLISKCVRFTEGEWSQIALNMSNSNYHSFSKYTRDALLKKRIYVANEEVPDRHIRDQINVISNQIGRIGNNYNQAVRRIHIVTNSNTEKTSVANRIENELGELNALTRKLSDLHKGLIALIDNKTSDA